MGLVPLFRSRWGGLATLILHVAALGLFVHGFLLTRVHLPDRAVAPPPAGTAAPRAPYDRVVWLMIDALRYDMVVADGRYRCPAGSKAAAAGGNASETVCHQGHMPYLSELARHPAARAFMFVADAPTTTTQRLKALATGGLPTFFDVGNSFSAGALAEDNLIDQLAGSGRRLAFLGDATWQQLFPRQWAWARPYPCFNVRDLHTVDDGVWEHLPAALALDGAGAGAGRTQAQGSARGAGSGAGGGAGGGGGDGAGAGRGASSWDGLLVAHYLGVDHCGHTHGVGSRQMAAKLGQMDEHVRQVVAALVAGAGAGGPYERTLLLVSGDHGQTLGGDHGGGGPEEVDSALVAVDIRALAQQQAGGRGPAARALAALAGSAGGLPAAPAPCRADCTCGVEGNQCAPDLAQLDLAPTLAAMLGVPTPFGNLGKLSAELWQLTAAHLDAGASADAGSVRSAWLGGLREALAANVRQVHTYLHAYAATRGAAFSRAGLARLDALHAAAAAAAPSLAESVDRCHAYLEAAVALARQQWTQFGEAPMLAGLALFGATLALQAGAALGGGASRPAAAPGGGGGAWAALGRQLQSWQVAAPWRPGSRVWAPSLRTWLGGLALVHAAGVFSFFYLLGEGMNVCYLVGAASLGLALAVGRAARRAGAPLRGVVALGIMSLRCNALMAVLGVAHHTGQGFWARLTVHEPQPAGDVERGWAGKLAGLQKLGAAAMAATRLDQLPAGVLAVLQHSVLCTLPLLALAALTERLQRSSGRGALHRLLVLAALASAAAYLQLEDAAAHGLLPAAITLRQLQQLAAIHLWPRLPAGLAGTVDTFADASARAALAVWPSAGRSWAALAALPLRDLLPRATYVLGSGAAALWLLQVGGRRLRGAGAATAAAQLVLALLVQVCNRKAPLILLLALLELVALARLAAKRAELAAGGPAGATSGTSTSSRAGSSSSSNSSGSGGFSTIGVAGELGALVALVAPQLFYTTGHLCEFAGLQHTAAFVGWDDFHLARGAALVALNTFGAMLLALLALPAAVEYALPRAPAPSAAKPRKTAASKRPGTGASGVAVAGNGSRASAALQQAVRVAGLVRAAVAFCAALSAGVQRRHLYVWALFAPRLAFEACFLLLADLALLVVGLL